MPVSYGLFQGLHLFCLTWHSIAIPPLISDSAEAVKMLLPVIRFDRSVRNRVSAVDHHTIADINTNVRCTGGIISALEENQISRLGRAFRDNIAYAHQTVCGQSSNTPTVAAVIDYIGNKPGAVEGGGRAAAAPQ